MPRYSRIGIVGFVALTVMGSCALAQMPTTRGKGNNAGGIDEGIFQGRIFDRFAAPKVPPPPPPPPQPRVFVGGLHGKQRVLTLEQPAAAAAEADDDFGGPPEERPPQQPAMPLNLQNAVLGRENFDRWVFSDGAFEGGHRQYLDGLVRQKVESFSRTQALTAAQESKLRLAGRGDIKRFLDRVEARRREFETARMQFNNGFAFLNALEPLRQEFEDGPFGEGSLFAKTLRKIENDTLAARPPGKD